MLAGVDSPRLVVSTKYSLGDFYSWLPLNETLEQGTQRRIVEMQSRREFESFGTVPNDLGVLHQLALRRFLAANPHVEGVWTWTQDGGPWRAGPRSLLLTTGFWQLYDSTPRSPVRLARDPDADPAELTADWARRWFSNDPDTVDAGHPGPRALARGGHPRALRRAVRRGARLRPRARATAEM